MASIFQKAFERFKQNAASGNSAYTTTLKTPVVKAPEESATLSVSATPNSAYTNTTTLKNPVVKAPEESATLSVSATPTSQSSTSRTLTNSNSIDDIIKQINDTNTSVDTSAQQNFDINKYLGGVKQGLQNLNNGQIQSGDVSKFTNMRTSEAQKKYEDATGRGLDKLEQFTDPNSDVYKTMFNRALDRFDATAAATNMSQSMRIANNNNLSDSAKRVAGAELNRVTQSNRAALAGDLTEQINKQMFDAAKEFTTQSINAADYEEGKFKTDADLAMREMTNRISLLQLQGDLSITEANLAYQQITDGVDNQWKNISAQLEKAALLLDSEDFKLKADEARTAAFDFWAERSVNRIIELKKLNGGTVTLDQVKNDSLTMSYLMKEMEKIGYEGNIDDYIQSRIDLSKTQLQIDQEAINALKQSYMNIGMDETTAIGFANLYRGMQLGAVQNGDGSWYVPGADGKPLITFKDNKPIFEDANKDDSGADIPTEVGKTYTLEGKLYQVGEDGKGVEIGNGAYYAEGDLVYINNNGVPTKVSTPTELWGVDATSILEAAPDSKVAADILQKRKDEVLAAIKADGFKPETIINNPEKMKIVKENAVEYTSGVNKPSGIGRPYTFQNVPDLGVPFNFDGKIYVRISDVGDQKKEYQHFQVYDLQSGQKYWIDASRSGVKLGGKIG